MFNFTFFYIRYFYSSSTTYDHNFSSKSTTYGNVVLSRSYQDFTSYSRDARRSSPEMDRGWSATNHSCDSFERITSFDFPSVGSYLYSVIYLHISSNIVYAIYTSQMKQIKQINQMKHKIFILNNHTNIKYSLPLVKKYTYY